MLTFSPTRALSRVDLPTLGRPTRAAKPLWNSGDGVSGMAIVYPGLRVAAGGWYWGGGRCAGAGHGGAWGYRVLLLLDSDFRQDALGGFLFGAAAAGAVARSEEHTSELQ